MPPSRNCIGGLGIAVCAGGLVSVDHGVEILPEIEVQVERSRMERAFVNLIGNAIEAMPRGGEVRISGQLASRGAPSELSVNLMHRAEQRGNLGSDGNPFRSTAPERGGESKMLCQAEVRNSPDILKPRARTAQSATLTLSGD